MPQVRMGGSFAPPLTDQLLDDYRALIDGLPQNRVRDALEKLHVCCAKWWELPEPNGTATRPHPVGRGTIVDLQADHKAELFDLIPWSARSNGTGEPDELDAIQVLLDSIPNDTEKPLRDAAHHLLWHVVELDLDREPITADKL